MFPTFAKNGQIWATWFRIEERRSQRRGLWYVRDMSAERVEQLKSILEQDPKNTFARYALGMEYSSAEATDAALAEFRKLLDVDANYANAFFMGAQALQRAERIEEATQWLQDGIACAQRTGNRHAENEMQALLDELAV